MTNRTRAKLSRKGVAPVIATILVIIIAITLSLVLSTFSSGLFQSLSAQESFDAKVVKVKKTAATTWTVGVFVSNTGQRDVTIDFDLSAVGGDEFTDASGACTDVTDCTLEPGQSGLFQVEADTMGGASTGDTVDVEVVSETGSLIFTTIRLP